MRFSIPLTPNMAIMWIINVSDRYMISYFMGTTAAGIYNASYSYGSYAALLMMPIGAVLYPTISKLYDEGNLGETKNYLSYSVKYFLMAAIPAAFGLSILARPVLQILTTPEFVPGVTIVPYVASGAIIVVFHPICEYIILLAKKTRVMVVLLSISAVLNIILNIALIPPLDILGAAVATLITYTVLGTSTLLVSRRYLKFPISLGFILKSIISSGLMTLCIWLIKPESILMVIVSIVAGTIIYFGILFALRGLSRSEISFFLSYVTGMVRKMRGNKS
jgi:O-antigen/teichoic acid export membrane protein